MCEGALGIDPEKVDSTFAPGNRGSPVEHLHLRRESLLGRAQGPPELICDAVVETPDERCGSKAQDRDCLGCGPAHHRSARRPTLPREGQEAVMLERAVGLSGSAV